MVSLYQRLSLAQKFITAKLNRKGGRRPPFFQTYQNCAISSIKTSTKRNPKPLLYFLQYGQQVGLLRLRLGTPRQARGGSARRARRHHEFRRSAENRRTVRTPGVERDRGHQKSHPGLRGRGQSSRGKKTPRGRSCACAHASYRTPPPSFATAALCACGVSN